MSNPFVATSVSSYNSNPPADDGSQVPANLVAWSTIKTKLPDPIKTAFDTSETATNTAISKLPGGASIVSTAISYQVLAADQGKLIKCTASGITITTPDALTVLQPFLFRVVNISSGDITVTGSDPSVQQNIDGVASITIPAGGGAVIDTDGTNWFTNGQNFTKTNIVPQGRLTLVTATPVMVSDQTGKTSVFFTPYNGDAIPIPNGTTFTLKEFTELTLTLVSNHVADSIYDIFVFLDPADNSTIKIGTGPVWSNSTAAACARGTGAGTTELAMLKGFNVNNVAATMRNGSTTYSVGAKSAIYVGSLHTDHTAGQVSCHVSSGSTQRKCGIWNAFNRKRIVLKEFDNTASWTYSTATIRAANNVPSSWSSAEFNVGSGTTCNGLLVFSGLAEEFYDIEITGVAQNSTTGTGMLVGVGYDSTTAFSGTNGRMTNGPTNVTPDTMRGTYIAPPSIGIHTVCALENTGGSATGTFLGTESNMILTATWFG